MMQTPKFDIQDRTVLPGLPLGGLRQVLLHQAQEYEIPVSENTESSIALQLVLGELWFRSVGDGIEVTARSKSARELLQLKDVLMDQLSVRLPDLAESIRWENAAETGTLPPNFQFAEVLSVTPVGEGFQRVRAQVPDLSAFGDGSIHFRIILPPAGQAPVEWPYVAENGSSIWPKGEKALHRPVYTVRHLNKAEGYMEFDIFLHDGGRVTDWVSRATAGTQMALTGPGGGGVPETERFLGFGDETAFPALARILETLPRSAQGRVYLEAEEGAACGYPVKAPAGIEVIWLSRGKADALARLALQERQAYPDHFLWFAAERSGTQKVRAAYKADGGASDQAYIAAYWTRD